MITFYKIEANVRMDNISPILRMQAGDGSWMILI